ncbi:MAG: hypothetical protein WC209_09645 [Ignavibacteriaceae bacterium]|jgi:predicted GH43/DUF377 family glycosyl hydrolase
MNNRHKELFHRHKITISLDGDSINLLYGAADTSIAIATWSIKELLIRLDEHNS